MNSSYSACRISIAFVVAVLLAASAGAQTTQPAGVLIEGRVIAPDRTAVAGARVTVYDASKVVRAPGEAIPDISSGYPRIGTGTTDARGEFRISIPNALEVTVAVQAEGFGLCLMQAPIGMMDDPLGIVLPSAVTLRARVRDPNGRPLQGVRLAPGRANGYLPDELRQELSQTSNAQGECTFPAMPAGIDVLFNLEDLRYVPSGMVRPNPDAPDEPQTLLANLGSAIEGRVLAGDTLLPVAGVAVLGGATLTANSWYNIAATTDAEGKYHLDRVRAGQLVLLPRPADPLSSQYAGKETVIDVERGVTIVGQDLTLVPGTPLRGKVTTETNGQPVAGVTIRAEPTQRGLFSTSTRPEHMQALTREDGTYELRLMPAEYRIMVTPPLMLNLVAARGNSQVAIVENQPATMDFALPAGTRPAVGAVKGTLVDETGNPVAGADLVCLVARPISGGVMVYSGPPGGPGPAATLRATSDAAGNFSLLVTGPSAQLYARKGDLTLGAAIAITPENPNPRLVMKKTAAVMNLRVVDTDAAPIPNAKVSIRVTNAGQTLAPRWGTTAADGTFTLAPVFPERAYAVSVQAEGYASAEAGVSGATTGLLEAGIRATARGGALHQIEPGKPNDITITLHKTDSFISGQVVDASGAAVPDVMVWATGPIGGRKSGRTDGGGHFRIDGLVAGEQVSITLNAPGARSGRSDPIKVGTTDAKIIFTPEPIRGAPARSNPPARGSTPARGATSRGS